MSNSEHTVIGHLVDIQRNVLTARLAEDDRGRVPTVTIGDETITVGRIGSYVLIQQGSLRLVAMVTRMSDQYAKPIVQLAPIGAIDADGRFRRGASEFPTTGAEVHAIGAADIATMFEGYRSKGFEIGSLTSHPSINIALHAPNFFGRHAAILGQTGSGKSWTLTSLVQRAVAEMPGAHIIILDLHGEYCWTHEGERHYAFDESICRHVDARDLEIPYWLMTFGELCDLFIDRSEETAHNQTAYLRNTLLGLREREQEPLGLERVTVDTPVYFPLDELVEIITNKNHEMVPRQGGAKRGELYGQFDRFLMRLESRLNDVRYDFLLKPRLRTTSDSLTDLLRDFVGLGERKAAVTVIDLSSVPFDVRPPIAAQIGRLAFEFNYWNPQYRDFPFVLMCEEAHIYIPRDSESQFAGSRKSIERIAKEGRKYGVGLGIVSQRPHEVSETVLAQCGTFMCLRISNPDDQAYVSKLVPDSESDLVSSLAGLGRGEALVLGDAVPLPSRVKVALPDPQPDSNDIDFHAKWTNGLEDLDVSAIVDRWRSQKRG